MRFKYNKNDYELAELVEPETRASFDIIAIFRVAYCIWENGELIETTKEIYKKTENHFEQLVFVNYFYGSEDVETAKEYIKNTNEINTHVKLKK